MHSTYMQQNVLTLSRKVDECQPLVTGTNDVRMLDATEGPTVGAVMGSTPPLPFQAGAYTRPRFGSTLALCVG